jgi:hypothetical protein
MQLSFPWCSRFIVLSGAVSRSTPVLYRETALFFFHVLPVSFIKPFTAICLFIYPYRTTRWSSPSLWLSNPLPATYPIYSPWCVRNAIYLIYYQQIIATCILLLLYFEFMQFFLRVCTNTSIWLESQFPLLWLNTSAVWPVKVDRNKPLCIKL